jgi:hypothetical protein
MFLFATAYVTFIPIVSGTDFKQTQWWSMPNQLSKSSNLIFQNQTGKIEPVETLTAIKTMRVLNSSTPFHNGDILRFRFNILSPTGSPAMLEILTGNGKESWKLHINPKGQPDKLIISSCGIDGKTVSASLDYRFRGVMNQSFLWPQNVQNWSKYFYYNSQSANDKWFAAELKFVGGAQELYIDGNFISRFAKPSSTNSIFTFRLSPGTTMTTPVCSRQEYTNQQFQPVDISSRINGKNIDGKVVAELALPPADQFVLIKDIPFVFPKRTEFNHLDISQSWVRESNLNESASEKSNKGSFGGRWSGAFNSNPGRLQFRVPNEDYDALYVIATSTGKTDMIPRFTVQFYRPDAGFPKNFPSPQIPLFSIKGDTSRLPVKNSDDTEGNLYLVRVPIAPGQLQEFSDLNCLEFELTKDTEIYRSYPDPSYYSINGSGLPSAVKVFALTLGLPPYKVTFTPRNYANVWTAPETPEYTVKLKSRSNKELKVNLQFDTASLDQQEKTTVGAEIKLAPQGSEQCILKTKLNRYGWHQVRLTSSSPDELQVHERSLAYLRQRDYIKERNFFDKGFIFGFWNWKGEHYNPGVEDSFTVMGKAGAGSLSSGMYDYWANAEIHNIARQFGIRNYLLFGSGDSRYTAFQFPEKYFGIPYDGSQPEKMGKVLLEKFKKNEQKASEISEPLLVRVFAEPSLGPSTHGSIPEYFGEPPLKLGEQNVKKIKDYTERLLISAKAIKAKYPAAKILMPHGDPNFAIPFLQEQGEAAALIDGVAVDIGYFERLPEQQFHQCSIHRLYQFLSEWKKYKKTPPVMATFEGPCITGVLPGALTEQQFAAHTIRAALLLGAYGINRQFATASPFDCGNYWGEQHYGSGLISRINGLNPHVAYCAYATMTRHLNDKDFVKWQPTGSLSTYCLQFRNIVSGQPMYAVWTIRGTRTVIFGTDDGSKVSVYDYMDNAQPVNIAGNKVSVISGPEPVFVYGLNDAPEISLGAPDHSDSAVGQFNKKVVAAGSIKWRQEQENDNNYTESFPDCIRRFPATMELSQVDSPAENGGTALGVKLPIQSKNRGTMPFYTTLYPADNILIPGKAELLSIWIKAASDWGRIVYVLRDAENEKWISAGSVGRWNGDDMHGWSAFNYDGWRLLRFELPGNAPYDCFRERGSTWWGCSEGDGIVDLPLKIEKIIVEKRPMAMYVNSLEKTDPTPVLLGDIYAEYRCTADMTEDAVRLSKIRMSPPPGNWNEPNPIADLENTGTLPPASITGVKHPDYEYDGTKGIFSFKEVADAASYDIWLSLNQDGKGALLMGKNITKSGILVKGFKPATDFYAFIVYRNRSGAISKPSPAFKFRLDDMFAMK